MKNSNKIKLSLFLVSLISVSVFGVQAYAARSDSGISRAEQIREEIKKIQEQRAQAKSERDDIRTSIEEQIVGRFIESKRDKFLKDFEEAIQGVDSFSERVLSRISKMEKDDLDVSNAKELFASSTEKISFAKSEYGILENLVPENIPEDERDVILSEIKDQSDKTKIAIKSAFDSLVEVVNALKEKIIIKTETSASSTNASSTEQ